MPSERRESLTSSLLSNPPSYRLPRFFGGTDDASSSDSGSETPHSSRSWISSPVSANTTSSTPFSGEDIDNVFVEEQSALGDILLGRVTEKVGRLQFKKGMRIAYDNKPQSKAEEALRDKLYSFSYAETYYYSLMMREPSSNQRAREQFDLLSMYGSLLNHFSILASNLDELKASYTDLSTSPSHSDYHHQDKQESFHVNQSLDQSGSPSSHTSGEYSQTSRRGKPADVDVLMWDDVLLKEFRIFLQFRVHMVTTYRYLAAAVTGRSPDYTNLCNELHSMLVKCTAEISHVRMAKLVTNLKFELQVLIGLFKVQTQLYNLRYLESILGLWNCQSTLQDWIQVFREYNTTTEGEPTATTEQRSLSYPKRRKDEWESIVLIRYKLYKWLKHFLTFSLSKATLYFHSALSKRELLFSGKSVSKFISEYQKTGIDYLSWIQSFTKWSRPLNVIFLADPEHQSKVSLAAAVNGQGYRLKRRRTKQPSSHMSNNTTLNTPSGKKMHDVVGGNNNNNNNKNKETVNSKSLPNQTPIAIQVTDYSDDDEYQNQYDQTNNSQDSGALMSPDSRQQNVDQYDSGSDIATPSRSHLSSEHHRHYNMHDDAFVIENAYYSEVPYFSDVQARWDKLPDWMQSQMAKWVFESMENVLAPTLRSTLDVGSSSKSGKGNKHDTALQHEDDVVSDSDSLVLDGGDEEVVHINRAWFIEDLPSVVQFSMESTPIPFPDDSKKDSSKQGSKKRKSWRKSLTFNRFKRRSRRQSESPNTLTPDSPPKRNRLSLRPKSMSARFLGGLSAADETEKEPIPKEGRSNRLSFVKNFSNVFKKKRRKSEPK
eukprot:gb/GECH01010237.1/.p1 GENE.gb/GECH01010237.1/~~gb/GECH01010237.1/.p1  ORF type:complete len:826 (+),score=187.15 gb/GECH01010237.1/:1-2478(+)